MKSFQQRSALLCALVALTLTACGGSGGSSAPAPDVPPALPEGLWEADNLSTVAFVLPASDGSAGEVWAIRAADGSPLIQGALRVDGQRFVSDAARYLTSNAGEAANVAFGVEPTEGGQLSFTSAAGSVSGPVTVNMTAAASYQRVATLTEWSGCWRISGDTIDSQLCVSPSGQISGYRGGCQLAGTISVRPEAKAVVNVSLQEQACNEAESFTGIGTYGRNAGVVVETARMLALKNVGNNRRSLVGLTR